VAREATLALLDALADRPTRPTVALDPAPAPGAAPLVDHRCVDLVTPNETEAAALSGALAAFDGTVVRTRGPDPVVVEAPGERFTVTPPAASSTDTTGAGDVFAGYLAAMLAERDGESRSTATLREAVQVASAAAALSVEASGVQRATPARETVAERVP
jgi:ribokinase